MKATKTVVIFAFLLAFAFQVSAQARTPKIVWENLQKKYDGFYDIKPHVVNEGMQSVFIYTPYFYLGLVRWDAFREEWTETLRMNCATGAKISGEKLKPGNTLKISLDNEVWDIITVGNDMNFWNFKSMPDYEGKGKYKLKLRYSDKKSGLPLEILSPEFEVIEKDFKK